jgi:hypothetical protein
LRSEAPDPAVPSPSWLPVFFMAARGGQEEGRDDDDSQSFGADETAPDEDMTGKSTRAAAAAGWRSRGIVVPVNVKLSWRCRARRRRYTRHGRMFGSRCWVPVRKARKADRRGGKSWRESKRARARKAVHCRGFEITVTVTLCTLVTGSGVLLTTRCGFIDSEDGRLAGGRLFGGDFFVERSSRSKVLKLPRRSVASRGAAVVWQEFPIR